MRRSAARSAAHGELGTIRHRLYEILEPGAVGEPLGRIVNRLLMLLIVINLAAVTLESVPSIETRYLPLFSAIEDISLVVFTVEYLLRIWAAPEHTLHAHVPEWRARLRFILSGEGLVDLVAVLPFWLAFFLPGDFRFLTVFRFIRFLKLVRHSAAMRSLLNAAEIADIMKLLRAQTYEPGEVVVRRGEPGHSIYFVAAGEVEIELPKKRVRLEAGHFFGEMAVLRNTRRTATVAAVSRTNLLVLDAHDLHALMERDPRIAERVKDVVRKREADG